MAQNNDLTSSLQNHFICHNCNKFFLTKFIVAKHLKTCGVVNSLKCQWCNLSFKNRGNLVTHAAAIHGDLRNPTSNVEINEVVNKNDVKPKSIKVLQSYRAATNFLCRVCDKSFSQKFQLTYHIRRYHFNLQAKIPYCELKKVNQVWFENVLNSNNIIEIKKTGHNTLVMRKLDTNTNIKVTDTNTQTIDLTEVYPIYNRSRVKVQCHICKKMYQKITIKKHMDEKHSTINRHECNNCKKTFKRSYFFLRHVCNKEPKKKGKKTIIIESVHSLKPVEIL